MRWQIGLLGLALVAALVVGGVAQQPPRSVWPPEQAIEGQEQASPPARVPASAGLASHPRDASDPGPQMGSAGELIGFSGFDGSGSQTITLVHAGKMQIAVYHIDRSGQIRLVSSRPIDADFSLSLNVTAPLPGQIRLLGSQVK
jgi:hypothetical protein